MHILDNFKVGDLIEHNRWGYGKVIANNGYDKFMILFAKGVWRLDIKYSDLVEFISQLKIKQPISKMETTEEKTMQEFEPITKDNIEEVLEYNGWKYDGKEYNNYKSTEDGFIIYCNISLDISLENDFKYNLYNFNGNINTNDFNEFLAFVQKRIKLKPLPKKPEFNFEQYLLDNGFEKTCNKLIKGVICFTLGNNSGYPVYYHNMIYNKNITHTKKMQIY